MDDLKEFLLAIGDVTSLRQEVVEQGKDVSSLKTRVENIEKSQDKTERIIEQNRTFTMTTMVGVLMLLLSQLASFFFSK